MPRPQLEALDLHLERAGDRVGGSRTAWCADYWRRECPVPEWWWRRSQKSNKTSKPPKIYENGKKSSFAHVLANISPKMPFFTQKYLTRYTHKTFFEENINFKTHYFSHCRVIPLQSFENHICPQPHGLGLMGPRTRERADDGRPHSTKNFHVVGRVAAYLAQVLTSVNHS